MFLRTVIIIYRLHNIYMYQICISSSAQLTHLISYSVIFHDSYTIFWLCVMICCIYISKREALKSYGIPLFFMLNLFLPFLLLCMKHSTWSDLTIFSLIGRNSPDKDHNFFLLVWRNLQIGEEYLNQVSISC